MINSTTKRVGLIVTYFSGIESFNRYIDSILGYMILRLIANSGAPVTEQIIQKRIIVIMQY